MAEFDIKYIIQSLAKGRAIAKHLVAFPTLTDEKLECQFPNIGIIEIESQR